MKILVAEDDAALRRALVRCLSDGGAEVCPVENGAEALAAIDRGFVPDIILSDWEMPAMGGGELCVAIRARGMSTPFVIISGIDRLHSRAHEVGATASMAKPALAREIMAMVSLLMSEAGTGRE